MDASVGPRVGAPGLEPRGGGRAGAVPAVARPGTLGALGGEVHRAAERGAPAALR